MWRVSFQAMGEGFRRVLGGFGVVVLVWFLGFLLALPAAWQVTAGLHESVGQSRVHENLRDGFDMGWFGEFHAQARGIETSFAPTVTGAGAFYANLETWISGSFLTLPPGLLGLVVLYVLLWLLLQAGVVERVACPGQERGPGRLLATGARFFWRFLRLFVFSGVLYVGIYAASRWVYRWLGRWTRDVTEERTVLFLSLAVLAVTAFLLVLVHLSSAYARIATVRDDRRGMFRAILHGFGWLLRHPLRTATLFLVVALTSLALLAVYAVAAPVSGPSSHLGTVLAFALGQAYLMARVFLRLWLLAGQGSLYGRLSLADSTLATIPLEDKE